MTTFTLIISTISIILFLALLWRICSYRYALPCPSWLAWMVEQDNPFSKINRALTIIQNTDIKPGMTVLDAGCGPGRVTIPLAHTVGSTGTIVALDMQEEMLTKVKTKAQKEHLTNILYIQAGLGNNTLNPTTFDRALLVTVLGEIPHQEKALKEIYLALKPGGLLSITEIIFDPHFQRQSWVRTITKNVGFKEKQIFGNWISYTLLVEKPLSH